MYTFNARAYEYPNHSNIPKLCFNERCPYSTTGVDYLGPLLCLPLRQKGEADTKGSLLFMCAATRAATRAVILQVVNNTNVNTFRNAFKIFICRSGCPSTMILDKGNRHKCLLLIAQLIENLI